MRKKLLGTYILVIAVTVIVTVMFSWTNVKEHFYNQVANESSVQIHLLEKILFFELQNDEFDFQSFSKNYGEEIKFRITIIDVDGNVLGDTLSTPETMDNHKYRLEFKGALAGSEDTSLRYSSTIGKFYFYYAIPVQNEIFQGALRIAIPVENVEALVWDLLKSVVIGLLIGLLLSVGIAYGFTKRFMEPIDELTKTATLIADGDYDNKVYIDNQDQIGELANAFNSMTFNMRKTLWAIEEKNAELEAILTSMDTGLAAIDENYHIIVSNDPFQKLLGIKGKLDGKIFYEITRNTHIFSVIEKSVDENEYIVEEMTYTIGEDVRNYKISATPIKGREDKKTRHGVLVAIEDVTNLRKLENIRRDFVSNVTHELKTPLTSIKGFVDALKNGAIEDPNVSGRFLDIIDIEADRLTILIEDILTLSEIESMRLDKGTGIYQISTIANEIVELLGQKAADKDLALVLNIQEDLPEFKCNHDRIKQLFINLVDNSIKYTDSGSVTIECKASRDQKFLVIKIMDTGIGIETEHLERLFERFYRVDKGRSRKSGGTGLGLSIVKHIVELYHGTIDVKSKYGKGTTFKVRLPFNS